MPRVSDPLSWECEIPHGITCLSRRFGLDSTSRRLARSPSALAAARAHRLTSPYPKNWAPRLRHPRGIRQHQQCVRGLQGARHHQFARPSKCRTARATATPDGADINSRRALQCGEHLPIREDGAAGTGGTNVQLACPMIAFQPPGAQGRINIALPWLQQFHSCNPPSHLDTATSTAVIDGAVFTYRHQAVGDNANVNNALPACRRPTVSTSPSKKAASHQCRHRPFAVGRTLSRGKRRHLYQRSAFGGRFFHPLQKTRAASPHIRPTKTTGLQITPGGVACDLSRQHTIAVSGGQCRPCNREPIPHQHRHIGVSLQRPPIIPAG